jgi:uncharacterized membrane protein
VVEARAHRTVETVGDLLRVGTLAVVTLVAVGTVLVLAAGRRPLLERGPEFDPARTIADLVALRPEGFLWLGLLLTVVLPAARVGLALIGFARERDVRAAAVGLAILTVLGVSVVLAVAGAEA